jgi:hypothetical protein
MGFISIVYIDMCYHPKYQMNYFLTEKCANKSIGLNHQVPCIKTSKKNIWNNKIEVWIKKRRLWANSANTGLPGSLNHQVGNRLGRFPIFLVRFVSNSVLIYFCYGKLRRLRLEDVSY